MGAGRMHSMPKRFPVMDGDGRHQRTKAVHTASKSFTRSQLRQSVRLNPFLSELPSAIFSFAALLAGFLRPCAYDRRPPGHHSRHL
jgi:hypothetical protein